MTYDLPLTIMGNPIITNLFGKQLVTHQTGPKGREIKRIFEHFNVEVTRIHRYEFASIELGRIKLGKYKLLSNKIINEIKNKYGYKK
mgnify:CR=1 FL=1